MKPYQFLLTSLSLCSTCLLAVPYAAHAQRFSRPAFHESFDLTRASGTTYSSGHSFVVLQLWDDLRYLGSEPDFLAVFAGLEATPRVFPSAFQHESPGVTQLLGSSQLADNFFEAGEVVGQGAFPVAVSATAWGAGKVFGSGRLREFGSDLFRSQAINGLFTGILKYSVNRTRPNGGSYSYPSGHTSSSFATAGVIYADFGPRYGIPAFILAGYVGISRLQEDKHYTSDVVAGAILGSVISLKLSRRDKSRGPLTIKPSKIANGYGLKFSYKF